MESESSCRAADSIIHNLKKQFTRRLDPSKEYDAAAHNPVNSHVYLATTPEGGYCAVKISGIRGIKAQQALDSAYLEAQIIGHNRLAHPNIIRGLGAQFGSSEVMLCMEFLYGGDLLKYITDNGAGLCDAKVRWIAKQLCDAISFIHSRGYLHCDIKTENILIEDRRRLNIKLGDFGFVTKANNPNRITSRGSIHYAAPELFSAGSLNTYQSEAWSLGVVIYVVARRDLPFNGRSYKEVAEQIKTADPKYVWDEHSQYAKLFPSPQCRSLIKGLLIKDPLVRTSISTAEENPWIKDAEPYASFRCIRSATALSEKEIQFRRLMTESFP